MKTFSAKRFLLMFIVVVLGTLSGGCRPSVRDVVNVLNPVPLGASRDQVRNMLVEAYGAKYPNWRQSYGLTDPPRLLTPAILDADKMLVFHSRRDHRFVRVHPPDLFEKMPPGALTESIGIVAEASRGNGLVSVYYDGRTNYLGFLAFTSGTDH